jgi:hypothetical protein
MAIGDMACDRAVAARLATGADWRVVGAGLVFFGSAAGGRRAALPWPIEAFIVRIARSRSFRYLTYASRPPLATLLQISAR